MIGILPGLRCLHQTRGDSLKGVLLPVAVVLAIGTIFVSVYLAAFHAPKPHRLPVAAVGTDQQVLRVEAGLEAGLPGGFSVTMYPSEAEARHAIEHRNVYAAYIAPGSPGAAGRNPKLLYAGANGPSATGTVTGALAAVAKASGRPLVQQDVVPSSSGDTRGMSVFYAAFGLILAGYLFGMMTYQMAPRLQFRWRMVSVASFGVLGGAIIGLLSGSSGFAALLRLASVVLLTLGNSTSGGVMPPQFLPGWLRPLSGILPVGVGVRAVQGASYFHNEGLTRGIAVLAVWIVVCAAILYARDVLTDRRTAA
ncbi:ABC transporter permease [Streptomyces sp. NPDC004296]|uniref:ABC transporter permease n=1 Tax=Streptomyces sp. NPDC004296 TaxID=3364697 RepID=UPI0036BBDBC2